MDNAQVEQELEELESRMERLRALYEQYFMGLEKLEPTVLRKDVDRRLWVLRREQLRNTGLRFKFQMLVQRYNTYQQYWQRIVREIENGTYRRDILKVAQRFGDKDAMTILGRKRAEQYKRLAANQLDRRNRRKGELAEGPEAEAAADRPSMPDITVEEEDAPFSLSADDLEEVDVADGGGGANRGRGDAAGERAGADVDAADDDEPPTPPRGLPPVRMYGEPDMESLLRAATVGVTGWGPPPRAPAPAPAGPPETSASAAPDLPAEPRPLPAAAPAKAERAVPGRPGAATAVKVAPAPAKPADAPAAASGKSRVAELAAQMRAKKQAAAQPKAEDLDIDHLFDAVAGAPKPPAAGAPKPPAADAPKPAATGAPKPPAADAPKPAAVDAPKPAAADAPKPATAAPPGSPAAPARSPAPSPLPRFAPTPAPARPPSRSPSRPPARPPSRPPKRASAPPPKRASAPPPKRASAPPPPLAAPTEPTTKRASAPPPKRASVPPPPPAARPVVPVVKPAVPQPARPAPAAPAARPAPAASVPAAPAAKATPARSEELSEQKMREIYAKYVGAKRAANESTAGITFDKLAASLRAQTDKLRSAHPTRSIDFEVVTKDGKTALRPVVK